MRKIIQLLQPTDKSSFTALCNDGSVWYYNSALPGWESLPAIPQDEATPSQSMDDALVESSRAIRDAAIALNYYTQTGSTYLDSDDAIIKCCNCGAVITDDNPRVHWDDKCKGCCDS